MRRTYPLIVLLPVGVNYRWPDVVMSIVCILMTIGLQKLKQKYDKTKGKSVLSSLLWFIGAAGNFFVVLLGIFVVMTVHHIDAGSICSKTVTSDCLTDSGHIPPGIQPILPITPIGKSNIAALATGAVLVALIGEMQEKSEREQFVKSLVKGLMKGRGPCVGFATTHTLYNCLRQHIHPHAMI